MVKSKRGNLWHFIMGYFRLLKGDYLKYSLSLLNFWQHGEQVDILILIQLWKTIWNALPLDWRRDTLTVLNRGDHHHKPSEPAIMLRSLENIQYIYVIIILNLIKNVCTRFREADTQCYTWEINYDAQYRIIICLWTMNRGKQFYIIKN